MNATSLSLGGLAAFALFAFFAPPPAAADDKDDFLQASDLYEDDFLDESELYGDGYNHESSIPHTPDPLRSVNRALFKFNDFIYRWALKPIARGYEWLVPRPARQSIGNFFHNLGYPSRLAGNLLQLKFDGALKETGQFLLNSTAGIGGLLAPAAAKPNLQTPKEDVGQALGSWGIGHGFYIVFPILGPSTLRDAVGRIGDSAAHPVSNPFSLINSDNTRYLLQGIETIDQTPGILRVYESAVDAAFDPYSSVKDGYLQRRDAMLKE